MQALDFGDLWLRISGSSAEGALSALIALSYGS